MSDELRPCHLCASVDVVEDKYCISSQPLAMCKDCGYTQFLCDWNRRPIEDTLRAELAESEKVNFELSARACIYLDGRGIYGDDRGNSCCRMKDTLARKDEEIKILTADRDHRGVLLVWNSEEIKALNELVEAHDNYLLIADDVAEIRLEDIVTNPISPDLKEKFKAAYVRRELARASLAEMRGQQCPGS